MLEIKITMECPGLPEAIHALADALHARQTAAVSAPIPGATTVTAAGAAPAQAAVPTAGVPLASTPTAPVAPAVPLAAAPVAPAVPAVPAAPAPAVPAVPAVPVTAPAYTLDRIAKAGAALVDAGKMEQLLALLGKYGVAAVTQLAPEQYGNFATELRALGAQI